MQFRLLYLPQPLSYNQSINQTINQSIIYHSINQSSFKHDTLVSLKKGFLEKCTRMNFNNLKLATKFGRNSSLFGISRLVEHHTL